MLLSGNYTPVLKTWSWVYFFNIYAILLILIFLDNSHIAKNIPIDLENQKVAESWVFLGKVLYFDLGLLIDFR